MSEYLKYIPEKMMEGKCLYCKKMLSAADLEEHITAHLLSHEEAIGNDKKEAFHLKVTAGEHFLHLLVDGEDELSYLDQFLRKIWMECCGHLSSFVAEGKAYETDWDMEADIGENMEKNLSEVLELGEKIIYTYDYGTPTTALIEIVGEYQLAVPDVMLLSRNEPSADVNSPRKNICAYKGGEIDVERDSI